MSAAHGHAVTAVALATPFLLLAPFAAGTVAQRVRARRRMDRLFAAGGAGSPVARITRGSHAGAPSPAAPGGSRPARGNLSVLPAGEEAPAAPRRAGAVERETLPVPGHRRVGAGSNRGGAS